MIGNISLVCIILSVVVLGCRPTHETPEPLGPVSKPKPTRPVEEDTALTDSSPLHVVFQQLGGQVSLHDTYFGAVLASGRTPMYRIDSKGFRVDSTLAVGLHSVDLAPDPAILRMHWESDAPARLVAYTSGPQTIWRYCSRKGKSWVCDGSDHVDYEGRPIRAAPVNNAGKFAAESQLPWGDRWVDETSIYYRKYHTVEVYDDEFLSDKYSNSMELYDFGPDGYFFPAVHSDYDYQLQEGKHFVTEAEGKKHVPLPERSPPIRGCGCESALCGGFVGKTFPETQEMISIGRHCDGSLAVERWPSKKLVPVVEKLPGAERLIKRSACPVNPDLTVYEEGPYPCPFRLVSLARDNIYAIATVTDAKGQPRPYIAHFDGSRWNDLSPQGAKGILIEFQHDGDALTVALENGALWFGSHRSRVWKESSPKAQFFKWVKQAPDGSHWAGYGTELFHETQRHTPPNRVQKVWKKVPLPYSSVVGDEEERYNVVDIAWLPDGSPIVHGTLGKDDSVEHVVLRTTPPKNVLRTSDLPRVQAPKVFGKATIITPQCGEVILTVLNTLNGSTSVDAWYRRMKGVLPSPQNTGNPYAWIEVKDGSDRYVAVMTKQYHTWKVLEDALRKAKLPIRGEPFCGNIPPEHRLLGGALEEEPPFGEE